MQRSFSDPAAQVSWRFEPSQTRRVISGQPAAQYCIQVAASIVVFCMLCFCLNKQNYFEPFMCLDQAVQDCIQTTCSDHQADQDCIQTPFSEYQAAQDCIQRPCSDQQAAQDHHTNTIFRPPSSTRLSHKHHFQTTKHHKTITQTPCSDHQAVQDHHTNTMFRPPSSTRPSHKHHFQTTKQDKTVYKDQFQTEQY